MRCVRGREEKSGQIEFRLARRIDGPARALDARSTDPTGEGRRFDEPGATSALKKKFKVAESRRPSYTYRPRKSKGGSAVVSGRRRRSDGAT